MNMRPLHLCFAMLACALATAGMAGAAQVNWNAATGLYTDGPSWLGGSVPLAADQASVQNGGTCTIDSSASHSVTELWAGNGNGTSGTITQNGGTISVTGWLVLGRNGTSVGTYNHSAGTLNRSGNNTIIGDVNGAQGTYNISGSAAYNQTAGNFQLAIANGAVGTVNQSGGTVNLTANELWVSSGGNGRGTYNLSGGWLRVNQWLCAGRGGSDGTINITGGAASNTLNNITIGSAAGNRGRIFVSGSGRLYGVGAIYVGESGTGFLGITNGTVDVNILAIGAQTTAAGSMTQVGGTFTARGSDNRIGGYAAAAANGYGYFNLSGGTANFNNNMQIGAYGKGIMAQSGGTVNAASWPAVGRWAGGVGVLTLSSGAVFNQTGAGNNLIIGEAGTGTLNVGGTAALNLAGGLRLSIAGTGIANLNGGTVSAPTVFDGGGASALNFNGGTLKATAAYTLQGLDNAFVYPGGATFNDNGLAFVVAQVLQAPTGYGVSAIGVATAGSGYIGPPLVAITGGSGAGATAIATVSGGQVTGFAITCPGRGYASGDTLTVALSGGGASTPATAGTVTLAVNTSGGLTKQGAGTLTLTGANTFSGDTRVVAGTLAINNALALQNSALNLDVADAGAVTFGQASTTIGGLKGSRNLACGAIALQFGNYGSSSYAGTLTATTPIFKYGPGTQTLTGTSAIGNLLHVKGGTLILDTGAAVTTTGYMSVSPANGDNSTLTLQGNALLTVPGDFNVSDVAVSIGTLNVRNTAQLTVNTLFVGKTGASIGVVNQTSGTVQRGAAGNDWQIGSGATSYGAYSLAGGTLNTGASNFQIGSTGTGLLRQTGGTVTSGSWPAVGRYAGGVGEYTITAGIFNQTGAANQLIIGEAGTGTLTVGGTAALNLTGGLRVTISGTGAVNLNGGTVTTPTLFDGGGTSRLNFNGGTLRAGAARVDFCQALDAAYIFSGGAVVDANGYNVTIAQALQGAAGYGASAIAVSNPGAGYMGPPLVTLAGGGGSGAKAIANIAGGQVTGFTITCPGTGYGAGDTLTATLAGGNPATPAVAGAVTLAANTSGGLTKIGAGTLTLTGASTFSGGTRIVAGTLALNNASALNNSVVDLNVADAGLLTLAGASTIGGLSGSRDNNFGASQLTLGNATASYSGALSGTGALVKSGAGVQTLSGACTYTGNTTVNGGELVLSGSLACGAGVVTVNGGQLTLSGGLTTTGNLILGAAAGTGKVLIANGGSASVNWVQLGNAAGAVSCLLNRGALAVNGGANVGNFPLGNAVGAYGYYLHDTATPTTLHEVGIAGYGGGDGVLEVRSGALTIDTWITPNRGNPVAGQSALMLVQGGTLNTPNSVNFGSGWGANGNQYGVFDIGAGGLLNGLGVNSTLNLNATAIASNTGVLTIHNGGVVELREVNAGQALPASIVNFNGGTLRAKAANDVLGANLDGVYVHSGGATLDTAGFSFTTDNALLAPAGNGITAIPLDANGAGYAGRPLVKITDPTGVGATAIATWNDATGEVTGIAVTCPGTGYTNPTVTLIGGGPTTPATVGTVTLGAAASGGLTKAGLGTLVLTGDSSYGGGTTISAGALQIGAGGTNGAIIGDILNNAALAFNRSDAYTHAGAIGGSGTVAQLGSGTLTLAGANTYAGATSVNAGRLTLAGTATSALTVNGGTLGGEGSTSASLTMNTGTVLAVDPTTEAALTANGVNFAGTVNVVLDAPTAGGAFTIIDYGSGPIAGIGNISASAYRTPTVTDDAINHRVRMIFASQARTWAGTPTATWDSGVSLAWQEGDQKFYGGDPVRFDDTATGSTTVTLNGSVLPASVVFANETKPYDLAGAGAIGGATALTKSGAGTLTIATAQPYAGGTTLTGGRIRVGNNGALGTGPLTLGGCALSSDSAAAHALAVPVALNAGFTLGDATDTGALTLAGPLTLEADVAVNVPTDGSVLHAFSGNVVDGAGTFRLTKSGPGTLALSGVNTYLGGTTVNAGTLALAGGRALADAGTVALADAAGAVLQLDASETIGVLSGGGATGGDVHLQGNTLTIGGVAGATYGGSLSGTGALTKQGAVALALTGASTFSGLTTVNAGTLTLGHATDTLAGPITVNGGTLDVDNPDTVGAVTLIAGTIGGDSTLTGASYAVQSGAVSAALAGAGALAKSTAGTVTLSGANTYSGGTTLGGGTLVLDSSGALGSSGPLGFGGGVLQFSAANTNDYSARFSTAAGQAYKLDTAGQDVTLATALTSSGGALTKQGLGTLTLAGANTYTGNTTVNGGMLTVSGTTATGTGNANIGDAAGARGVLDITGSGNLTVNWLSLGNNAGAAGAVYQGGPLTLSGGANYATCRIGGAVGGYGYYNAAAGALTMAEAGVGSATGGSGLFEVTGGTVSPNLYFIIGRIDPAYVETQYGVVNVTAGTLSAPTASVQPIAMNWTANKGTVAILNVSGSGSVNAATFNATKILNLMNGANNTGIVNLLAGGTITANSVGVVAAGTSLFNFNGGTLKAAAGTANGATFLQGLTAANVFAGGAVIDNNGQTLTIAQALLAPAGSGVSAIPVATGGDGYSAPPIVQITGGGGSGATALATIAGGAVTGIQIVNPGTGYAAAPAVALLGGGATTPATLGAPTLAVNAGGGLTKNGNGTLTLTGVNTYTGETVVNGGTLSIGSTRALPSASTVRVALGAVLNLPVSGTRMGRLFLNGVEQAPGIHTAASLAPYVTGPGLLVVGSVSLLHRWSFNGDLRDSAGGSDATIVEVGANNVTLGYKDITLAGGARAAADYVRLGSNLLPDTDGAITLEFWATPLSVQSWSRIFDFGSDTTEYLTMSWTRAGVLAQDLVSWRDNNGAESARNDSNAPYTLGTPYHILMTIEPGAGAGGTTRFTWYTAPAAAADLGVAKGTLDTAYTLAALNDLEDNLGRSFYGGDNTANASYDEVRIWLGAKTAEERTVLHSIGPDNVVPPQGSIFMTR